MGSMGVTEGNFEQNELNLEEIDPQFIIKDSPTV